MIGQKGIWLPSSIDLTNDDIDHICGPLIEMSNAERCVNLLILSCDKYQDLWAPLLAGFRRFWVDPNRRTYLVSNEK